MKEYAMTFSGISENLLWNIHRYHDISYKVVDSLVLNLGQNKIIFKEKKVGHLCFRWLLTVMSMSYSLYKKKYKNTKVFHFYT